MGRMSLKNLIKELPSAIQRHNFGMWPTDHLLQLVFLETYKQGQEQLKAYKIYVGDKMNPLKYNPFKSQFNSEHIHENEIKAVMNQWISNINEENLSAVVEMYAPSAILLPTLSDQIYVGREQIQQYFIKFLGKDDLNGHFTKMYIQIADDTAIASGMGVFTYLNSSQKNRRKIDVDFRYSFVVQKGQSGWHILNHHNSLVP